MEEHTSMRLSKKLKEKLRGRKIHPRQSFEEVIWGLLEDKKKK